MTASIDLKLKSSYLVEDSLGERAPRCQLPASDQEASVTVCSSSVPGRRRGEDSLPVVVRSGPPSADKRVTFKRVILSGYRSLAAESPKGPGARWQ
jgi:hypothetical protein